MKFFTADEHYGHTNILKFCKRPFSDIAEMREALISAHNYKVGRGDLTYHVGDMFWRTTGLDEALKILARLNGMHAFVYGNHDELIEGSLDLRSKFVKIAERLYLDKETNHPKIVLDHYAGRVWRNSHNGSWQLYGHSHAALPEIANLSFDVGVDTRSDYAPWSLTEIAEKMAMKKAAGAMDPLTKNIKDNPQAKAEGAEIAYPAFTLQPVVETLPMPQIPQAVWDALKEAEQHDEEASGAYRLRKPGRCVE